MENKIFILKIEKKNKEEQRYFGAVSSASSHRKVPEQLIKELLDTWNEEMSNNYYGLVTNKSCQANLIASSSRAAGLGRRGEAGDVICLRSAEVSASSLPREHHREESTTEQVGTGGLNPGMSLKTLNWKACTQQCP